MGGQDIFFILSFILMWRHILMDGMGVGCRYLSHSFSGTRHRIHNCIDTYSDKNAKHAQTLIATAEMILTL